MELLAFGKELLQDAVEFVTSYKFGQVILRQVDRVLWVLEKSARWAVPPPLDQNERPQPELIRPLPWVFFLALLVTLRVTRESISIINLFRGKPPLRSTDVVMYLQSKRRYLRTLKYQGNRNMRARSQQGAGAGSGSGAGSWLAAVSSLLQHGMCFRRRPTSYGNNNSTHVTNNEEILVVNSSNRENEQQNTEDTMERLIEKMMVDLNTDTDDDSSYTLTNAASVKSVDDSEDGDPDSIIHSSSNITTSTPNKSENKANVTSEKNLETDEDIYKNTSNHEEPIGSESVNSQIKSESDIFSTPNSTPSKIPQSVKTKEDCENFVRNERNSGQKVQSPPKKQKVVNGQANKNTPKRKKGGHSERRDSDVPLVRITAAEESDIKQTGDKPRTHQTDN